jgi:hypothetical protein
MAPTSGATSAGRRGAAIEYGNARSAARVSTGNAQFVGLLCSIGPDTHPRSESSSCSTLYAASLTGDNDAEPLYVEHYSPEPRRDVGRCLRPLGRHRPHDRLERNPPRTTTCRKAQRTTHAHHFRGCAILAFVLTRSPTRQKPKTANAFASLMGNVFYLIVPG